MAAEYGARGLVGILPPQANTTVEAELGVLLGPDVATVVSRLTCSSEDSRTRLTGYFHNVGDALRAFDTARPDVALFACTGSTYLVGLEEEKRLFGQQRIRILSAAAAVLAALDALQARRVALVSPYPDWLTEVCVAFWRAQGREVVDVVSPEGDRADTRRIYSLRSRDAAEALMRVRANGAQAILITGTGMPSLRTLQREKPVLSSNLCLAWAATQALAGAPLDAASLHDWLVADAPWRSRLSLRFPGLPA